MNPVSTTVGKCPLMTDMSALMKFRRFEGLSLT